jgi:transcriptional regulator with XRE-family HTH domain
MIGHGIKRIRKLRKLKQKNVASDAGITQSYLSNIEANKKNLTIETLDAIAKALGVKTYYIYLFAMEKEELRKELYAIVDMIVDR